MKVIMLKDVKGVGRRGTAIEVSDGYALNYLIAGGFAEQATPQKLQKLQQSQQLEATALAAREAKWATQARQIDGATIIVAARANSSGGLFTQLPAELIIEGLRTQFSVDIPPEAIVLNAPIKQIGEQTAQIKLGSSVAKINVSVIQAS